MTLNPNNEMITIFFFRIRQIRLLNLLIVNDPGKFNSK